jgi:hypothetical protein
VHNKGVIDRQLAVCRKYGAEFSPPPSDAIFGYAFATREKDGPTNGLRHPPEKGTSGWYIWEGQTFSDADDFFQPMHIEHVPDECPEALDFLALPPGWRFLVDGDYVDVWFDKTLLSV